MLKGRNKAYIKWIQILEIEAFFFVKSKMATYFFNLCSAEIKNQHLGC
jgi:hypothetical protein